MGNKIKRGGCKLYCPNCGEKNPENVDKCVFCQSDLNKVEIGTANPPKKDNTKTIIIAIIAVAVAVVIGIIYYNGNKGVPNVVGTQESVAIQTLTNKGYVPVVEYEESD